MCELINETILEEIPQMEEQNLLIVVERIKVSLISRATGGAIPSEYVEDRC